MKTKQISGKKEILLIGEVPENYSDFRFFNDKDAPYLSYRNTTGGNLTFGRKFGLPAGDWKFASRLSEITDEQAAELIHEDEYPYYNYTLKCKSNIFTPIDSLLTLLESAGVLFENPEGDKPKEATEDEDDDFGIVSAHRQQKIRKWMHFEGFVFRPESTLVFVKEK